MSNLDTDEFGVYSMRKSLALVIAAFIISLSLSACEKAECTPPCYTPSTTESMKEICTRVIVVIDRYIALEFTEDEATEEVRSLYGRIQKLSDAERGFMDESTRNNDNYTLYCEVKKVCSGKFSQTNQELIQSRDIIATLCGEQLSGYVIDPPQEFYGTFAETRDNRAILKDIGLYDTPFTSAHVTYGSDGRYALTVTFDTMCCASPDELNKSCETITAGVLSQAAIFDSVEFFIMQYGNDVAWLYVFVDLPRLTVSFSDKVSITAATFTDYCVRQWTSMQNSESALTDAYFSYGRLSVSISRAENAECEATVCMGIPGKSDAAETVTSIKALKRAIGMMWESDK